MNIVFDCLINNQLAGGFQQSIANANPEVMKAFHSQLNWAWNPADKCQIINIYWQDKYNI